MVKETLQILLICDDQKTKAFLSEKLIVEGGYAVSIEPGGHAALHAVKDNNFDVIIAKLDVPDMSPMELVKGLKKIDPDCIIIAYIEDTSHHSLEQVARLQVYDYFVKPISFEKLFFLIKKGAELRSFMVANRRLSQGLKEQNSALEKQNVLLAKRIEDSTKNLTRLYEDLRSTYMRTIKVLAQAIEARDHYTRSHSENVAKYAVLIAREMGLSVKEIETVQQACELHDLGKIGVEDSILMKPSALTDEEWKSIRKHPITGAQILEPLTFLNDVTELIRQHHEHFDGTGYPEGRKGDDIALGARIIHLADAYEAMSAVRAYRKTPLSKEQAVAEIKKHSGTQFDPKVVEVFLKVVDKF
jgi:putative nucleotidyltransferase with HDIG domain